MLSDPESFFAAIIAAGAILSGFCGTFLAFRIQREANYYRQPALDFRRGEARNVDINRQQFGSAFFLLMLATLCSIFSGFLIPLLALAHCVWAMEKAEWVVGGLVAAPILLAAYFFDELVHYHIFRPRVIDHVCEWSDTHCPRILKDSEWREEFWIVLFAVILAAAALLVVVYVVL
jgi:hypothetical protein